MIAPQVVVVDRQCPEPAGRLTLDHVVPLIRGGKSVRANIVPACKDCNSAKQSLLPWEWNTYLDRLARPDAE